MVFMKENKFSAGLFDAECFHALQKDKTETIFAKSRSNKVSDQQDVCHFLRFVAGELELSEDCYGRAVLGRYLDSLCQSCPYRSQNLHPL